MPPKTYKQVLNHFEKAPQHIRNYFDSFPSLVEHYSWDVSVSYVFTRIEAVKHETLYCGLVKNHGCESTLTRTALDRDHMSRGRFRDLFSTIFSQPIDPAITAKLSTAEAMRDKIAHGKSLTDAEVRQGLVDAFDFAEAFSDFVYRLAGFRPFGELRGFKGRKASLSRDTTKWVLLGMGIGAKR